MLHRLGLKVDATVIAATELGLLLGLRLGLRLGLLLFLLRFGCSLLLGLLLGLLPFLLQFGGGSGLVRGGWQIYDSLTEVVGA